MGCVEQRGGAWRGWVGGLSGRSRAASFRSMFEKHYYWEIILLVAYGSLPGQCDQRYGRVTETCTALLAARKTHCHVYGCERPKLFDVVMCFIWLPE